MTRVAMDLALENARGPRQQLAASTRKVKVTRTDEAKADQARGHDAGGERCCHKCGKRERAAGAGAGAARSSAGCSAAAGVASPRTAHEVRVFDAVDRCHWPWACMLIELSLCCRFQSARRRPASHKQVCAEWVAANKKPAAAPSAGAGGGAGAAAGDEVT
jgi:hypothetical protein